MSNSPEQILEIGRLERDHLERFHAIRERLLVLQADGSAGGIEELLAMNAALIVFAEERLARVTEKA